jgi:predicted nucleic acid-binding protein
MVGYIDTNVFIHAQSQDAHAMECLAFVRALQRGEVEARLEPLVLHELTYILPRYRRDMSREDVGNYLLAVLAWRGVIADRGKLAETVERWRDDPSLGFVDAYLGACAAEDNAPVFTKNVRDFAGQGVEVPDPLPGVPR